MEVEWPNGPNVCRNDMSALWFKTVIIDIHGSMNDVWMDERSALALPGVSSKEAFIEVWQAGDQTFPIMASMKVVRTIDHVGGASQPATAETQRPARFVIVQADVQPFDEPPSQASLDLTNYRKAVSDDTSRILPAALHMIQDSPCYALQMVSDDFTLPRQRVVALTVSSENPSRRRPDMTATR